MATKKINTEIEKATNDGMCIFDGCEGKATGWIYNIDCSVDGEAMQLLHACKKHVDLFQCHEDRNQEMFGV